MNYQHKKTKIVCTIGPASWTEEKLVALYEAGMNVARLNFSHKDYDEKKMTADLVHRLNAEGKTKFTLALDTKWPELRTGKLESPLVYEKGEIFPLTIDINQQAINKAMYCDYEYLVESVEVWSVIKVESGLMDVVVLEKVDAKTLKVQAQSGATIKSYRHINLPGIKIKLPGFTEQDKEDILFGIANKFDVIFMSFVRNKSNLIEARQFLDDNGGSQIKIYSKIENQEGMDNLDEIIEHSDWIMIARGDLGIEVPIEKLPTYQMEMLQKCKLAGKPVIMATQLMETMMKEPYPTRAEISDVYHAVVEGSDMIMTSGETALGDYPVECIQYMSRIALEAEATLTYQHYDFVGHEDSEGDIQRKYLVKAAIDLCDTIDAAAMICFTRRWFLSKVASAYRPSVPVYGFTANHDTWAMMNMYYGVYGHKMDSASADVNIQSAIQMLVAQWSIKKSDTIVAISDTQKNEYHAPSLHILKVSDYC
jgi:pyruvate kinase